MFWNSERLTPKERTVELIPTIQAIAVITQGAIVALLIFSASIARASNQGRRQELVVRTPVPNHDEPSRKTLQLARVPEADGVRPTSRRNDQNDQSDFQKRRTVRPRGRRSEPRVTAGLGIRSVGGPPHQAESFLRRRGSRQGSAWPTARTLQRPSMAPSHRGDSLQNE